MARSKNVSITMFVLWLLIVPPGIFYILLLNFPEEAQWPYLLLFTLLAFLTVLFPIRRNGKPLLFVGWVTIPVFLLFGLIFEIIIMQVALLAKLTYKKKDKQLTHLLFYSVLFFILSITAAIAFHFAGGEVGSFKFWPTVIAVAVYQIVHRILYDVGQKLYESIINKQTQHFTKESLLESIVVISIFPFALTLYFLVDSIGLGAFILLGIPFFFLTILLRLYDNSEKVNEDLQLAGAIGHELSNHLSEEKVINQFVKKVSEMFSADYTYLFDHHSDWLELIGSYENGVFKNIEVSRFTPGYGIAGSVLMNNNPVIYSNRAEWLEHSKDYTPDGMESIITIPISRNQKIEAVLFLASVKKEAFSHYQLQILDILCSYFTVSVEKARYVEETVQKSERCGLTKLYNYFYLDERLSFEKNRIQQGSLKELSLLMIDIDHFKRVNDTYGHQSGNDILVKFGQILSENVPENGIVGRYGGEEFIYILPGIPKTEAKQFAEKIRSLVSAFHFQITPDLGTSRKMIAVKITVSIGVSTMPDDTDDTKSLLRNADRALYLGAKRAGRNRVAGYVK